MPLLLSIFQDDLLEIAVDTTDRKFIEIVEHRPFATTFEFIVAEFDIFNKKHIKR